MQGLDICRLFFRFPLFQLSDLFDRWNPLADTFCFFSMFVFLFCFLCCCFFWGVRNRSGLPIGFGGSVFISKKKTVKDYFQQTEGTLRLNNISVKTLLWLLSIVCWSFQEQFWNVSEHLICSSSSFYWSCSSSSSSRSSRDICLIWNCLAKTLGGWSITKLTHFSKKSSFFLFPFTCFFFVFILFIYLFLFVYFLSFFYSFFLFFIFL